jgi:thiol-disulfide isomerase/thioredoxin
MLLLGILVPVRGQTSAARTSSTAAKSADPALIDLDGYNKILATYKGKPTLVSFWATWCEPCRYEYPTIVQMAKDYASKGLAVFGVSFDSNADMHLVRDFLAKNKPAFPNYRQRTDIDVDAFYTGVNPQWTGTMPETVFYGRDGKIVLHFEGEHSQADFEKAIQIILASH